MSGCMGGNSPSHFSEEDEGGGVTFVKGIRLSDKVIDRMKQSKSGGCPHYASETQKPEVTPVPSPAVEQLLPLLTPSPPPQEAPPTPPSVELPPAVRFLPPPPVKFHALPPASMEPTEPPSPPKPETPPLSEPVITTEPLLQLHPPVESLTCPAAAVEPIVLPPDESRAPTPAEPETSVITSIADPTIEHAVLHPPVETPQIIEPIVSPTVLPPPAETPQIIEPIIEPIVLPPPVEMPQITEPIIETPVLPSSVAFLEPSTPPCEPLTPTPPAASEPVTVALSVDLPEPVAPSPPPVEPVQLPVTVEPTPVEPVALPCPAASPPAEAAVSLSQVETVLIEPVVPSATVEEVTTVQSPVVDVTPPPEPLPPPPEPVPVPLPAHKLIIDEAPPPCHCMELAVLPADVPVNVPPPEPVAPPPPPPPPPPAPPAEEAVGSSSLPSFEEDEPPDTITAPPPVAALPASPEVVEEELRQKIKDDFNKSLEEELNQRRLGLQQQLEEMRLQAHAEAQTAAQALVEEQVKKTLEAEKTAQMEKLSDAIMKQRMQTEDQKLMVQLYRMELKAHQLAEKEKELKKRDTLYKDHMAKLEAKCVDFYKRSAESYQKGKEETHNRFARFNVRPVCGDLQSQILKCYRESAGKTLSCSSIASAYMQCVDNAKKDKLSTGG
ncbi:unnamed protein product [Ophioblennius macclurei]